MVKLKSLSIEEAKSMRRVMKPRPIVLEYMEILKHLDGQAKEIDANAEGERAQTIKNRIARLGKSLLGLQVKRVGDKVLFWVEQDAPTEKRTKSKKQETDK